MSKFEKVSKSTMRDRIDQHQSKKSEEDWWDIDKEPKLKVKRQEPKFIDDEDDDLNESSINKTLTDKIKNQIIAENENLVNDILAGKKDRDLKSIEESATKWGNTQVIRATMERKLALREGSTDGDLYTRVTEDTKEPVLECDMTAEGEITVKGSPDALVSLMKLAGMNAPEMTPYNPEQEPIADEYIDEEPEYANGPDEEYSDMEAAIPSGDDLHKEKGSFAAGAGGDNPMNAEFEDSLAELKRSLR